ncbi:MAG: ATP-binding protein, partial [FCB group bacterium]|nr:ATP-binding protein [FCB group bacterium]
SSSCLETANNETVGAMVMLNDLTAIKRLEQKVQRADRLSSLGILAAGMAHEIKNPLVSIKTFTQLLLERYNDPDFRNTFSEVVPHEVERIDSIVLRLLDFARPKAPRFAPHNLRRIIDDVLALVDNEVRKSGITLEKRFSEDYLEVYGDEQQLHQVFLNLVLNALRAMRENEEGTLTIAAEYHRHHLRRRGVLPFQEAECVQVSVSDTGCGIAKENLDRIFTPFFTTKPDGSGLGLAVVHGIVSEHGGEIDVRSIQGQGTTFTVLLPLAKGKDSDHAQKGEEVAAEQ